MYRYSAESSRRMLDRSSTEKGLAINRIVYITLFCRREKTDWDLHIVHAAYSCNIS